MFSRHDEHPGPRHAGGIMALCHELRGLYQADERIRIQIPAPVRLDEWTLVQPDIAIVRRRAGSGPHGWPRPEDCLLLVEVCGRTLPLDLEIKTPLYGRRGIPEAWVVDLRGRRIVRFFEPQAVTWGRRETYMEG